MKKTVQCIMVILCVMCALGFSGCKSDATKLAGICDASSMKAFLESEDTNAIVLNDFICPPFFCFNNTSDKVIDLDGKTITCLGDLNISDEKNAGYKGKVTFCDSTKGKACFVNAGAGYAMFSVGDGRTLSILDGIKINIENISKQFDVFKLGTGGNLDEIDAVFDICVWGGASTNQVFCVFRSKTDGVTYTGAPSKINKICGGPHEVQGNAYSQFYFIKLEDPCTIGEVNTSIEIASTFATTAGIIDTAANTTISNIKGGPYKVYNASGGTGSCVGINAVGTITSIGEAGAKVTIDSNGGTNTIAGNTPPTGYPNAEFK